jgi:molybdopterin-guanine dinucleotide biosynthesis protein A
METVDRPMTGLLLAGGRSSRMGVDKAELEFEGIPLARRTLDTLLVVCDEVLVASGDGRRLDWLEADHVDHFEQVDQIEQVADLIPDAGPLSGLVAGLERARRPLVAVLAVDMPFASASVLRLLANLWDGQDAVVPVTDAGPEPLHAVYAPAAATPLRAELERGERSIRRALASLAVRRVEPEEWRQADPSGRFAVNLNRPEDLPPG